MKRQLVALGALLLSSCGVARPPMSSGTTGAVSGTVANTDWTFRVNDALASDFTADGPQGFVQISLCESACAGERGNYPRMIVVVIASTPDAPLGPGTLNVSKTVQLAAMVPGRRNAAADSAKSGSITIDTAHLRPGGLVTGTFDVEMQLGSKLKGSFTAPVVYDQPQVP